MDLTPGWLKREARKGLATQRRPTPPAKEPPDMTDDAEVLAELRVEPNWPRTGLDPWAAQAAAKGKLQAAYVAAWALTEPALRTSSHSSVNILAAHVPVSDYSALPNVLNLFYTHLRDELRKVLDLPIDLWSRDDD
jgi:hypothetical protein